MMLSLDWRAALTDLGVAQVMEHTARTAAGGSNLYAGMWGVKSQVCLPHAQLGGMGKSVWLA